MRTLKTITIVLSVLATLPTTVSAKPDPGRETLAANDGWASLGTGTTGGAAAAPNQVYTVHNRRELIAALNNGVPSSTSPSNPSNEPKIIYVIGTIDGNVDDNNEPLTCQDYYRLGYSLEGFLAAYDPATWGKNAPTGPLEAARLASRNTQQDRVRIRIGSNTTIIGVGPNAVIRGMWLDIRGTSGVVGSRTNIIIRNITFRDTYDCFPEWSPKDGSMGAWNALYDAISLRYTDHVWIDHNTFEDRDTADSQEPTYFGVHYERHDGLSDITNESDLVTVSWNRFSNHDKVMLIGSSDSTTLDTGKLRVTIHDNLFQDVGQRTPRVRFGKVHVYNNYYDIGQRSNYVYSLGVGKQSAIYAENNYFNSRSIAPDLIVGYYNGTAIHVSGSYVNGHSQHDLMDLLAAYNTAHDPDLSGDVGWVPELHTRIGPTQSLPGLVPAQAGPFNWVPE